MVAECWAAFRDNCDEISREHYISKGLLPEIVTVDGPTWAKGGTRKIPRGSLTTKCLCKKHNSDLSVLDFEAIKLHAAMALIKDEWNSAKSNKVGWFEVDGEKLLQWCCKTIAGVLAMENQEVPEYISESAFSRSKAAKLGFSPIASENTSLRHLDGHIGFCQYISEPDPDAVFYSIVLANIAFFIFPTIQDNATGVFHGIVHSGRLMDRMKKLIISNQYPQHSKRHKTRIIHFQWPGPNGS